jgi:hypothetical protein
MPRIVERSKDPETPPRTLQNGSKIERYSVAAGPLTRSAVEDICSMRKARGRAGELRHLTTHAVTSSSLSPLSPEAIETDRRSRFRETAESTEDTITQRSWVIHTEFSARAILVREVATSMDVIRNACLFELPE